MFLRNLFLNLILEGITLLETTRVTQSESDIGNTQPLMSFAISTYLMDRSEASNKCYINGGSKAII